ncbi:MBL fold metallo-hydrolase [Pontixanthobacter sp. CEM42]|uniref:MBL fold metallo-hydrolase n=1 Tax=Pontixanthobacter sp. CEM42 TaxID=2792077 RepID=UPI001ADFFEBD|nr:MBL fold metallo-hydrolase [Pontixanthobacter sp. CEM42]
MRVFQFFLILMAVWSVPLSAQNRDVKVDDVIDRLTAAYGGEALRDMSSASISSDRRLGWLGQGQTARFIEYESDNLRKHFDLKNERGSVERWTFQNGNVYHNRYVVTGQTATNIDYMSMTQSPSENGGFWQWYSGDFRSSDTLLAYRLATSSIEVNYAGEAFYRGRMHDKLTFSIIPDSLAVTVFVARGDGLIRRATMEREIGAVNFIFASHRKKDGITYASESQIYVDDVMTEYEWGVSFVPNADLSSVLQVEPELSAAPEMVDHSELTVDALSANVFMVGREDYALFAIDGQSVIAVGLHAGLKERYDALLEHLGRRLPLSAVIATHHHSDHLNAVQDVVDLRTKLYLTNEAMTALATLRDDTAKIDTQILRPEDTVGPFSIFVRPTAHSVENAFVYHAEAKVLFQDDHYHGLIVDRASRVQPSAMQMFRIISDLGLEVSALASGHARKTDSWDDFVAAAERPEAGALCPSRRDICMEFTDQ